MLRSWTAPSCISEKSDSSETPPGRRCASCSRRTRSLRACARSRARRSFSTTCACSPAAGGLSKPMISMGSPGPASSTFSPRYVCRARTFPQASPATIASPTLSVPRWTSIVATGPRPTSRRDSMIGPEASAFGFAFSSSSASATSSTFSRRSSRFVFSLAETSEYCVVPPHSSGWRSSFTSSWRTRCGSAPGLSILFTATTIGTSAARAWAIDSCVCGLTPSSAATTSTATSVTFAPRARMAVNASWPGVSRNVILRPSCWAWYAPMCCVMPPASVSTTEASRIASSSVVLPWSTWPMIVTTGGRATRSSSASSYSSGSSSSSATCLMLTSRLTSVAISCTASSESDCVIVTISPRPIMILMIWAAGTPSAWERSLTETPEGTVTGPVGAGPGALFGRGSVRSRA